MCIREKIKASIIHLALSILLVSLTIGTIVFFFFPIIFINITNFKEVASIIVSVDLVLGPLLTFIVFSPNKKTLKFDLAVVVFIQLVALFYGAYSLYQVHPVYVTFNIDRFTLISAKDATPQNAKYDEYKVSMLTAGKLAFAKLPTDRKKRNEIIISTARGGRDLDQRVEYYEPYKENISEIIAKSLDPKIIFEHEMNQNKSKKFLSEYKTTLNQFVYLPLNSMEKDAIIVLDKKTADPITTLDIDPWNLAKLKEQTR